ncbi:unnamed protein product [Schistosoma mattheei]|uniref:Uncharacterized protein n=1 Tax=Schistosoma mattheei TaxID=31246 RepID=A0A183PF65_9TREM|nr:unnamed protein product [Schistosoma mattheei]
MYPNQGLMFNEFPLDQHTLRDLNRHEKSLGLLTEKFVQLLKEAPDGILDLKMVCFIFRSLICLSGGRFPSCEAKKKDL